MHNSQKLNVLSTNALVLVGLVSSASLSCAAQKSDGVQTPQKVRPMAAGAEKVAPVVATFSSAGVPLRFTLLKTSYVTLVVEDATGKRVRNLVAETRFPAGKNLVQWDGYDDGVRNEAGDLVRSRVKPGRYTLRGLTHEGIKLVYEFTAYGGGTPAWKTADRSGAWMADHSAPLGAVFLPAGLSLELPPFSGELKRDGFWFLSSNSTGL